MKLQINESQKIEFKQSWRDEYIKWLSAFANTEGGKLYIGVDDEGNIVGVENSEKLLEDIPNKVRDILGILIDVNEKISDENVIYLEIITDKYPYPISYKGSYYYRTGSSTQEIKGAALDKFLLGKQGKTWDGVPVPYFGNTDLDPYAFKLFRDKAYKKKRIDPELLKESDDVLVDKLRLREGDYLKRATALLFAKEPMKYVMGSMIKIGYFKSNTDLVYQDVIEGNLFEQVDKVMELIFTKYLSALISYEGIQRVESFPVSELAFREALINAVVHKDYSSQNSIQISVYDDKLLMWNAGDLPQNWTIDTLLRKHTSEPHNPLIAYPFFLAGYIESWGRGIEKIIEESQKFNGITPQFRWENGLWVEFYFNTDKSLPNGLGDKLGDKLGETQQNIIKLMQNNPKIAITALASELGISTTAIEKHIKILKKQNIIQRIGSAKGGHWEILK
ncbi:RNA-binding domain-containing protein [Aliarcobacter butzleri]|uniref:RNA-binding domain-containing protein n=1 Tax=Aliarcobacter butzleri TaxID=28197 RepID=UPI000DAF51DD|nr:RNA-binding domain-containing protein [Aliarcobacter butzleri]MCG3688416.1 putative DNA binding domain-containing protein [Aliarcobacter butzleri]MCT7653018.1 putative DNA binding domain-containing protein [Aliarcobacter butzleri]PZQ05371.1 MAG: transcriptional regulator [Aliarcobacter butzleri]